MGAMNRGLNLPQIQRIMQEFERESATMDMKEEMMSDAVDDVMEDDLEDEEEEGDKILKQVLDEIGVDFSQQVRSNSFFLFLLAWGGKGRGLGLGFSLGYLCSADLLTFETLISCPQLQEAPTGLAITSSLTEPRQAVALGEGGGASSGGGSGGASGGGGGMSDEDALQARLDALRRG